MAKYIIKESELRSVIQEAVKEEFTEMLNEGEFLRRAGNAVWNTAKIGALSVLAPGLAGAKFVKDTSDILNGNKTIGGMARSLTGKDNSRASGTNKTRRETRMEKQRSRLSDTRAVSFEYGKPETVPGLGKRNRLAKKRDMTLPIESEIEWGDFGRHYHDEGDRMWFRKIIDTERQIARNTEGANDRRRAILMRRYKKRLVDWLKARDKDYVTYIKNQRY